MYPALPPFSSAMECRHHRRCTLVPHPQRRNLCRACRMKGEIGLKDLHTSDTMSPCTVVRHDQREDGGVSSTQLLALTEQAMVPDIQVDPFASSLPPPRRPLLFMQSCAVLARRSAVYVLACIGRTLLLSRMMNEVPIQG